MNYNEYKSLVDLVNPIIYGKKDLNAKNIVELTRGFCDLLPNQDFSYLLNEVKANKVSSSTRTLLTEYYKHINFRRNIFKSYVITCLDIDEGYSYTDTVDVEFKTYNVKEALNDLFEELGFEYTIKFLKYLIEKSYKWD